MMTKPQEELDELWALVDELEALSKRVSDAADKAKAAFRGDDTQAIKGEPDART